VKISCVGGGPAGLYFAILMKRRDSGHDITVFERDPSGFTYGWGVVYWEDLLDKLRAGDPETGQRIWEDSMHWRDQVLDVGGRLTVHQDKGGYAIGRRRLLEILAERATELGVQLRFESPVESPSQVPASDLIVACDGAGSRLRESHASEFRTHVAVGRNKYCWLGTHKIFDTFRFAMVETEAGWIWFHGYGFDNDTSTCVVECAPETWTGLHLDTLDPDAGVNLLSRIFAGPLDGQPLLDRGSRWLDFRTVTNETWHHDNVVLMGDAAHTAHFTIGSGTRLALEDAMALTIALHGQADLESALDGYGRQRQADLRQLQDEARLSARWFENVARYRGLNDEQFFTLLRARRSPLLPRLPPLVYYRLNQVTQEVPLLGKIRRGVASGLRAARKRRSG
jgi:2-polyprenyl-6-methoxyphenol hydroxylase-like FAD-dependent oxidoreductase